MYKDHASCSVTCIGGSDKYIIMVCVSLYPISIVPDEQWGIVGYLLTDHTSCTMCVGGQIDHGVYGSEMFIHHFR